MEINNRKRYPNQQRWFKIDLIVWKLVIVKELWSFQSGLK